MQQVKSMLKLKYINFWKQSYFYEQTFQPWKPLKKYLTYSYVVFVSFWMIWTVSETNMIKKAPFFKFYTRLIYLWYFLTSACSGDFFFFAFFWDLSLLRSLLWLSLRRECDEDSLLWIWTGQLSHCFGQHL